MEIDLQCIGDWLLALLDVCIFVYLYNCVYLYLSVCLLKQMSMELVPPYISKNYYMRPERPVHQTLRTLRTLTVTLNATSAGRHIRTPFPIYPCVLDVPTTFTTKPMRPDALRP